MSGLKEMKVGAVTEWDAFTSAVIDRKAYDRIVSYIEHARASASATILAGGRHLADVGYFVQPTLIETSDAADRLMTDEIFGPVLTAFVYDDERLDETMRMVDETTPYALTGAVFAEDRAFLERAAHELKMSAGNFYINDKSTGAVVGQQPFGGSRLSGTFIAILLSKEQKLSATGPTIFPLAAASGWSPRPKKNLETSRLTWFISGVHLQALNKSEWPVCHLRDRRDHYSACFPVNDSRVIVDSHFCNQAKLSLSHLLNCATWNVSWRLGTNDKAGSPSYLLRWSSPQAVKQSFIQQAQWKYPHMEA